MPANVFLPAGLVITYQNETHYKCKWQDLTRLDTVTGKDKKSTRRRWTVNGTESAKVHLLFTSGLF